MAAPLLPVLVVLLDYFEPTHQLGLTSAELLFGDRARLELHVEVRELGLDLILVVELLLGAFGDFLEDPEQASSWCR